MASFEEVQRYLNDFQIKFKVFGILFRDYRKKNAKALLKLEISTEQRKKIIESIKVEDYSEGPLDDTLYGISSMWVFGKAIKGTEVYIKISMGMSNSQVICISFHDAAHGKPLSCARLMFMLPFSCLPFMFSSLHVLFPSCPCFTSPDIDRADYPLISGSSGQHPFDK